ncbi:hypothetical protein [Desulfomicrobium norvegicum]|uniref:hypothetical protein n=1 Tax=Desulfomicrobium norvegicum (strain DSM 1741 / NCIMB 8310) TaxID=52561 RepID=UPI000B8069A6|nr:hypothetical protein [Desulfomicrobium norvegicum]
MHAHGRVEKGQVKAYAGRLKFVESGKLIAEHKREFGRDKTVYDPWRYAPLLDRKPGALLNCAPFAAWRCPRPSSSSANGYDVATTGTASSPGFSPASPAMVSTWSLRPAG